MKKLNIFAVHYKGEPPLYLLGSLYGITFDREKADKWATKIGGLIQRHRIDPPTTHHRKGV
jgi:hypothetical protein